MWNENEIEYFLSKIINSVICGLFIGVGAKIVLNIRRLKSNKINLINKKEYRIVLTKFQKYSREYIVSLGKQAIRCGLTNKILIEPVVSTDGRSYENKDIIKYIEENYSLPNDKRIIGNISSAIKLYDNRVLREFIEISSVNYNYNLK